MGENENNKLEMVTSKQNEPKKKGMFSGKFFAKFKAIKHIEIYIAIILGAVVLLIYFSTFGAGSNNDNDALTNVEYTSLSAYAKDMEEKLEKVLSSINGAGEVNVMITYKSGIEMIIAYSEESKEIITENSNGKTTTITIVKTPIIVGSGSSASPIVLSETLPEPKSIIVVASGAKEVKVKLDILTAVQTLFNLPNSNIEIIAGK